MAEKSFTLRLPDDLHTQMAAAAESDHISLNTALIHAAKQWLDARPVPHADDPQPVKVHWVRPRNRFDDGDDPDVPMPDHAVAIGKALGHISFVLANLVGQAKLRQTSRDLCTEAVDHITEVARYLDSDGPRPKLSHTPRSEIR